MGRSIIGQDEVIERLLIGLLANGNLLIEGLPGLAKTRAIRTLATNLDAAFSRIQFTPDLLPSDVTGTEVYHSVDGRGEFRFEPGPVFANIVLADEINRAPAKVQSALLEAMEERQVTVAGKTHSMPALFMVMATQNPIEHEGTYPLPEAQMDRFLMHVRVGAPSVEDEIEIVRLVRSEESAALGLDPAPGGRAPAADASESGRRAEERTGQDVVLEARQEIAALHVSPSIERYIADLVHATRRPDHYSEEIAAWLDVGASPRASIALDRCSRAHAWLRGRGFVTPDDVRALAHPVLRHRVILSYEAQGRGIDADRIIDAILERVALP
ncbi:MAG TPA: AAA family ATPase [Deltaproteobacteria bacterium]|nr:AAA family ATPase [Deltaproteobacteria bacterium]